MPYAFAHMGIPLGVFTVTAMALVSWVAVILMLKAKDISPMHYESLYELGYLLMGRKAIFAICSVVLIQAVGLLQVYFIIFGDTMSEVFMQMITGNTIEGIQTPSQVLLELEEKSPFV